MPDDRQSHSRGRENNNPRHTGTRNQDAGRRRTPQTRNATPARSASAARNTAPARNASPTRNAAPARNASLTWDASAPRGAASARAHIAKTPQKPSRAKFLVPALIALVIVCIIGIVAIKGCSGSATDTASSNAGASSSLSVSDKEAGSTPAAAQDNADRKKSAAGNEAVAHVRTEDERRATSSSANDVTPGPKTVYLTFDDGPSPNTGKILDVLDSYGIKATWFVKGNQPELAYVKDIWAKGNQVALHTYSHDYGAVYASTGAFFDDLESVGSAVNDQLGFTPTLTRFPGGSKNSYNQGSYNDLTNGLAERGYHYFDWNISSGDGGEHDADFIYDYIVDQADGCHSCCVLMHDSAAKDTTVEALPRIIEYFIDNDFEFDVLLADSYGYRF